jgi:3-oxoacyl-[acyl-carrier protein] reductase
VELSRAAGAYEAKPFSDKHILFQRTADAYAAEGLLGAFRDGGGSPLEALPVDDGRTVDIVVLDASGCQSPADYHALYATFHPVMRRIARNGRVLIAAAIPEEARTPVAAAMARGVEGFTRSLGKELGRRGVTVNLAYVARDATDRLEGVVRFFCGKQTTYVSGQAIRVTSRVTRPGALPAVRALNDKIALVTGAARGIGMATAERLAQEGARVVCLDIPAVAEELNRTCARIGAIPLAMDITDQDAPTRLADYLQDNFGGLDVLVHNAGMTRDRALANMEERQWDTVLNTNFAAIVAIDEMLLSRRVLRDEGRIVCLSSISGIAGNFGQTNYATSKAALIGYVAAQAPLLAARGICINAVAPGFIETAMTDRMPFLTREFARRLNSVQQGGKPRDAAELITFLGTPGAYGISGETIRVCGQGLMGA